jgi:hypothetical protein
MTGKCFTGYRPRGANCPKITTFRARIASIERGIAVYGPLCAAHSLSVSLKSDASG